MDFEYEKRKKNHQSLSILSSIKCDSKCCQPHRAAETKSSCDHVSLLLVAMWMAYSVARSRGTRYHGPRELVAVGCLRMGVLAGLMRSYYTY